MLIEAKKMRKEKAVTKRSDSVRMALWASANKETLNGKSIKQIKAALHREFNGTTISDGAVSEIIEGCGIEVGGNGRKSRYQTHPSRLLANIVGELTENLEGVFDTKFLSDKSKLILALIRDPNRTAELEELLKGQ